MDTSLLIKIYEDLRNDDTVLEANKQMEGKSLLERWQIGEKALIEKGLLKNYVGNIDDLEDAEWKQIYSALFPEFPAIKILGTNELYLLAEKDPELSPYVVSVSDPSAHGILGDDGIIGVIHIPWFISPDYVHDYLFNRKKIWDEGKINWEIDDLLSSFPFEVREDIIWNHLKL